jgi:hypothetical protein
MLLRGNGGNSLTEASGCLQTYKLRRGLATRGHRKESETDRGEISFGQSSKGGVSGKSDK